jgi:hypothetical protein
VTELLPVLMNDIIATAPEDQKVRSTRSQVKDVITPPFHLEVILQHEQDVPTLLLQYFSHHQFVSYGSTHVL